MPVKENVYMACSRDGGLLSYLLPADWANGKRVHIIKMDDPKKVHVDFKINEGNLEFQTEPNSPYKVFYR